MNQPDVKDPGKDTSENPSAARLEAILHVLFSSEDEQQLQANREKAKKIMEMSNEEITNLLKQSQKERADQYARTGDFLPGVRK